MRLCSLAVHYTHRGKNKVQVDYMVVDGKKLNAGVKNTKFFWDSYTRRLPSVFIVLPRYTRDYQIYSY